VRSIELDPTGWRTTASSFARWKHACATARPSRFRATARCCPRSAALFRRARRACCASSWRCRLSTWVGPTSRSRATERAYYQDTVEFETKNAGGTEQTVLVRALNVQLLAGNQDQTGYQVCRSRKSNALDRADGGLTERRFVYSTALELRRLETAQRRHPRRPFRSHARRLTGSWSKSAAGITFDRQHARRRVDSKQLQQLCEASSVLSVPFRRRASIR